MSLLSTARAMDDSVFRWRVMGACIQHAATYESLSGAGKEYALAVLSAPHDVDTMMLCLVASNPVIAQAITTDNHGGVSSEGVPDGDILYIVNTSWDLVATRRAGRV